MGLERRHERPGACDIGLVRGNGIVEQLVHGVVEADDVEAVVRGQAVERKQKARLGLGDRGAAHGAGIVDHEHHLAGRLLVLRGGDERRRHQGEHVVGIAHMLAEQADGRRGRRGRLPGQLEVAVGRHHVRIEPHDARIVRRRIDRHGVMRALHVAQRKAGVEMHGDGDRIGRRLERRIKHWRGDAIAIRHRVADATPAAGSEVDGLRDRRRAVARRDHERHPQRGDIARAVHRLLVFDLDHDRFAGSDIGDRVGKDVRPLLLHERRLAAGALGLLVDRLGLDALLDLADHDAVADHHLERIDRAAVRQRIDVDRLDPVLRRIVEHLGDATAQRRPGHGDVDVGRKARRFDIALAVAQQQRAHMGVGERRHRRQAGSRAGTTHAKRQRGNRCNRDG